MTMMSAEFGDPCLNSHVQTGLAFLLFFFCFIFLLFLFVSWGSGFRNPLLLSSYISPPFVSPYFFWHGAREKMGVTVEERKLMRD